MTGNCDLHQRRADRRRRRVVGGPDRRGARAPHRLEGQRLDPGVRRAAAAHPNSRFTAPAGAVPDRSPTTGRTRPACRSSRSCSAAAARRTCRWSTRRSRLGARRLHRRDHRRPRRPPPPRAPSASCAATRSRCCRSAATTWPTTGATGSRSARPPTPTSCRRSTRSTGSARTPTAVPVAGLRREQPRARVDRRPPRGPRRSRSRPRSAASRSTGALDLDGPRHLRGDHGRALPRRPRVVAGRGRPHRRSTSPSSATQVPAELHAQLDSLKARLTQA